MTLKEIGKWIAQQQEQEQFESPELQQLKTRLYSKKSGKYDRPFYIWSEVLHKERYKISNGNCCFHHIIGPPQKNGKDMPLQPYQQLLWKGLRDHKHIWIKKSRGIGVTEFLLRYIAYQCIAEKYPKGTRVCIVTGPRIDLAEDLISRFKGLFSKVSPKLFDKSSRTVAILNGVRIEAFPSHHVDTMRGLTNVRAIISDESDYYPKFQQLEVRAVCEGYIGKPNSDPTIILVSTPKAPGGLMQQIELEPDSLYFKLFFDYRYGLEGSNPIYSLEQIERAKLSPEFGREYEGKYLGLVGNVFSISSIENAQKIKYNPSSSFGIVVTRFVNEKIQVVIAEEHDRPQFSSMIDRIWEIKRKHGFTAIYCDTANPSIWQDLKREFGERYDSKYVFKTIAEYEKNNWDINSIMRIIPVPFSTNHAKMLQHSKSLLEDPHDLIAIDKRFDKLLTSLRTAVAEEYKLKKEDTSYSDILDAFRLSLIAYKRKN
jgi:hypothetical protein